jgi:UDP-N-acetylglucosamine--N-acetylmuramyl-(pentapeptide) pyrophosphoryl-undecaprenol N-acetylglucosamine transferase
LTTHRVILTGGGTGGHVYPALAVAEHLKKNSNVEAIVYVGVQGHIEENLAKEAGLDFIGLKVIGLPRQFSTKLFSFPWQLSKAVWQALKIIKDFKPTIILGTGGYAAAPILSAAVLKNIPFAIHEPDSYPGLVNKIFAPHARLISLGMSAAENKFVGAKFMSPFSKEKIVVNGNPISERYLHLPDRTAACVALDLDPYLPVVLVTGGSQGAQALNEAVYALLPQLISRENAAVVFQILHQVGEKNWQGMESNLDPSLRNHRLYKPRKYIDDLSIAYAASNLAICRSGAMTIAELTATGTPAIFIPYPHGAQNHQMFNAKTIAAAHGAKVIPQNELTGGLLYEEIERLLSHNFKMSQMRQQMFSLAKPLAAAALTEQLLGL